MLRGAGKRGGSLTGHVAEEFLLSLKLGGGVFHRILNLKVYYPSVTLTRSFFTTWVGTPRGFLWTRNCVVTFGLAIAGFYLKNLSL